LPGLDAGTKRGWDNGFKGGRDAFLIGKSTRGRKNTRLKSFGESGDELSTSSAQRGVWAVKEIMLSSNHAGPRENCQSSRKEGEPYVRCRVPRKKKEVRGGKRGPVLRG